MLAGTGRIGDICIGSRGARPLHHRSTEPLIDTGWIKRCDLTCCWTAAGLQVRSQALPVCSIGSTFQELVLDALPVTEGQTPEKAEELRAPCQHAESLEGANYVLMIIPSFQKPAEAHERILHGCLAVIKCCCCPGVLLLSHHTVSCPSAALHPALTSNGSFSLEP